MNGFNRFQSAARNLTAILMLLVLAAGCAQRQVQPPVDRLPPRLSPAELEQLQLPDVTFLSVRRHRGAGGQTAWWWALIPETQSDGRIRVPHLKVDGVVGGSIHFELLLPDHWNGRFLMGGGGGYVGRVVNAMRPTVNQGYATVGTDTGHQWPSPMGAGWALDNLEARLNFGYLAIHRVAETAKAVIRTYYGHPPRHSYFVGCSRGGGQALMAVERYPDDFDGVVAGAPAFHWTGFTAAMVRTQQLNYPDPADLTRSVVTPDALRRMAEAVMAACDGRDGVRDGIIDDPPACTVAPAAVPGLTEAQRNVFRAVYDGPTGIYPGLPPGAESGSEFTLWVTGPDEGLLKNDGVPNAWFGFGTEFYKYFVFNDPQWSYRDYDFSRWAGDTRLTGTYMDAVDTDLRGFKKRGGRLILWHGWADAALSARATVAYYQALERADPQVREFARLFLLPGVGHCGGGAGCGRVDWLGAVVDWVEQDRAPQRITARREDDSGRVIRTRPLYPYPLRAVYRGDGSPDDEKNYILPPP